MRNLENTMMDNMHKIQHQIMKGRSVKKSIGKSRGMVKNPCEKDAMKVVYISTPMKVKTSASKFREIVQELTGRESDVVRIMEKCDHHHLGNINNTWIIPDHDHGSYHKNSNNNRHDYYDAKELINIRDDRTVQKVVEEVVDDNKISNSSTSSEEFIEQFDDVYMRGISSQQSFDQFDHHNLLYDSIYNQIDALGSY